MLWKRFAENDNTSCPIQRCPLAGGPTCVNVSFLAEISMRSEAHQCWVSSQIRFSSHLPVGFGLNPFLLLLGFWAACGFGDRIGARDFDPASRSSSKQSRACACAGGRRWCCIFRTRRSSKPGRWFLYPWIYVQVRIFSFGVLSLLDQMDLVVRMLLWCSLFASNLTCCSFSICVKLGRVWPSLSFGVLWQFCASRVSNLSVVSAKELWVIRSRDIMPSERIGSLESS